MEDGVEIKKQMYPIYYRLRNLSYSSHIFCNIEIEYTKLSMMME